jgi:hypothetical protein
MRIYLILYTKFSDIVHYLGGSVRKDYGDQVTHVVSFANLGEKYLVRNLFCSREVFVYLFLDGF